MGARRNRSAELVDWDPRDWRSGGSTAAWTMLPAAVLAGAAVPGGDRRHGPRGHGGSGSGRGPGEGLPLGAGRGHPLARRPKRRPHAAGDALAGPVLRADLDADPRAGRVRVVAGTALAGLGGLPGAPLRAGRPGGLLMSVELIAACDVR